jgi:hypothetical protein
MTNNRTLDRSPPKPDRIKYVQCPRCHDHNPMGWVCYGCLAKGHKPQSIDADTTKVVEFIFIWSAICLFCLAGLVRGCS